VVNEQNQNRLLPIEKEAESEPPLIDSESDDEREEGCSDTQDESISSTSYCKISVDKYETPIKVIDAILLPSVSNIQKQTKPQSITKLQETVALVNHPATRAKKNEKLCKICQNPFHFDEIFRCTSCLAEIHTPCYQSFMLKAFNRANSNCCVMCIETSRLDIDPRSILCLLCF
jgi:hypothetical protein